MFGFWFFLGPELSSCDAQNNRLLRRGAVGKHEEQTRAFSELLSGLTPRPHWVSLGKIDHMVKATNLLLAREQQQSEAQALAVSTHTHTHARQREAIRNMKRRD